MEKLIEILEKILHNQLTQLERCSSSIHNEEIARVPQLIENVRDIQDLIKLSKM